VLIWRSRLHVLTEAVSRDASKTTCITIKWAHQAKKDKITDSQRFTTCRHIELFRTANKLLVRSCKYPKQLSDNSLQFQSDRFREPYDTFKIAGKNYRTTLTVHMLSRRAEPNSPNVSRHAIAPLFTRVRSDSLKDVCEGESGTALCTICVGNRLAGSKQNNIASK